MLSAKNFFFFRSLSILPIKTDELAFQINKTSNHLTEQPASSTCQRVHGQVQQEQEQGEDRRWKGSRRSEEVQINSNKFEINLLIDCLIQYRTN